MKTLGKKLKSNKFVLYLGLLISLIGIYYSIYHFSFNQSLRRLPTIIWICLRLLPFILLPYFLNFILYKVYKDFRFGIIAVIILAIIVFNYIENSRVQYRHIMKGGVVVPAQIDDKRDEMRVPPTIYYKYNVDGENHKGSRPCDKSIYEGCNIGDTILIIYSKSMHAFSIPHKYFPTKEEIKECEKGVFYIGGKRVDSLP